MHAITIRARASMNGGAGGAHQEGRRQLRRERLLWIVICRSRGYAEASAQPLGRDEIECIKFSGWAGRCASLMDPRIGTGGLIRVSGFARGTP